MTATDYSPSVKPQQLSENEELRRQHEPPASNDGGNRTLRQCSDIPRSPRSTGHLDWFSVTYPRTVSPNEVLPSQISSTFKQEGHGFYGYEELWRNEHGVQVMAGGTEAMGIHMTVPARTLEEFRLAGLTDRMLMRHAIRYEGRATRVDLALNLWDGQTSVGDFAEAYRSGQLKTPGRAANHVKAINEPDETFYIGKRSSQRFLRVYNKAAEMGMVNGEAWLRLELECKKLQARAMAGTVAQYEDTRQVVNAALSSFVDWPANDEITQALASQDIELPVIGRKMTDTQRWLFEQVAPALARYETENPSLNTLKLFDERVREFIRELQPGIER